MCAAYNRISNDLTMSIDLQIRCSRATQQTKSDRGTRVKAEKKRTTKPTIERRRGKNLVQHFIDSRGSIPYFINNLMSCMAKAKTKDS